MTAQQFFEWNDQLQKDEILVREIIDIDTNYMEDESTGPSAKQKNAGETDKDEGSGDGMMMILTQHLLQWKLRLNQRF